MCDVYVFVDLFFCLFVRLFSSSVLFFSVIVCFLCFCMGSAVLLDLCFFNTVLHEKSRAFMSFLPFGSLQQS